MKRFLRELTEPWGLLLAATSAGAAWAVQLPVVAAAGIGGAVLIAKAGIAAWQEAHNPTSPDSQPVTPGSAEAGWLDRAEDAANDFSSLSESMPPGPLADQVRGMRPTVEETLDSLVRLAGRASVTAHALGRIDAGALADEKSTLQHSRASAGTDVRASLDKSLASLERQQAVHQRLSDTRAKLLAQLQSGAHGLEELVARLIELDATSAVSPAFGGDTVGEVADQLEGLRRGVVETDKATRQVLGDL